jgi:hypothetical protein
MVVYGQIRSMLSGGDRRSIGKVADVIVLIEQHPRRMSSLVRCLWDEDACVRMRAADALEKISRERSPLLKNYKAALLTLLAETTQQEVRWHLALVMPRLLLTQSECRRVADALQSYLEDRSSIVRTFAMQGLADLTTRCASLRSAVVEMIRVHTRSGTPAMRARGRKLLQKLEQQE